MDFVEATLFHHEQGSGSAVLLIPGLAGLAKFWGPVVPLLATTHRPIAIDHPGMGASPAMGPQAIDMIAHEVIRLVDRLEIKQFHVVGHSTGGLVAQALALDHAARVGKVVLSSTWARPDRRFRDLFRLRQHVLREAGVPAYAALGHLLAYPARWYEDNLATDLPIDFGGEMRVDAGLTHERIDMLLGYQRIKELPYFGKPTLVVGAQDDNIVPFSHSQELASRIPGAQLIAIAGGHFAPTTSPFVYARAVAEFLGESS